MGYELNPVEMMKLIWKYSLALYLSLCFLSLSLSFLFVISCFSGHWSFYLMELKWLALDEKTESETVRIGRSQFQNRQHLNFFKFQERLFSNDWFFLISIQLHQMHKSRLFEYFIIQKYQHILKLAYSMIGIVQFLY